MMSRKNDKTGKRKYRMNTSEKSKRENDNESINCVNAESGQQKNEKEREIRTERK